MLEGLLDRLPERAAKDVKKNIEELRRLLLERRAPRLVLVGRRGSGKSSFINAVFGERVADLGHVKAQTGRGKWHSYRGEFGTLNILDTRGLQEGSRPEEDDSSGSPLESVLRELEAKSPDAVLFLVKAKEVDAAIDADLQRLVEMSEWTKKKYGFRLPVVGVISHCDELEPKNVKLHEPDAEEPEDLDEKLARVRAVEAHLRKKIEENGPLRDQLVTVIGISSYQSWKQSGERRADERWRVGDLLDFLFGELPKEAQMEFARLAQAQRLQTTIADKLTTIVASICVGLAAVPIPVADIAPITSLQVSLVIGIGYVGGRQMTMKTAGEFLAAVGVNVGAAVVMRELARALVKWLFPGGGSVISAGVAYAGTIGVGRAARAYFIEGVDEETAKQVFKSAKAQAKESSD